jgi:5-methylcytosine-specific restriction protein A
MPLSPPRLCAQCRKPSCDCRKKARAQNDRERGTAAERGYTWAWSGPNGAAKTHLKANPLCVHCLQQGLRQAAKVVDHIIPHRGNMDLFWDSSNWQSLCKRHHDQKTARGE